MNKKHLIWASFAIVIGVFAAFFIFQFSVSASNYLGEFLYEKYGFYALEEKEKVDENEEIKADDISFNLEDNISAEIKTETPQKDDVEKNIKNKVGEMWGTVKGLTMFRGNPTKTWYGTGPMPYNPENKWKYPDEKMCSPSTSGGKTSIWCGSGWTGQPVVWEKENGDTEVIFGAYDRNVHFVDAQTGENTRPPFPTGDIIKGSVTLDPDGFPLLYFGSRDNKLRILALDREVPTELWALDSTHLPGIWNNDWDSNPVVIEDILYEGGENGWFFAIKLNRKINEENKVEISPEVVFSMPSYNKELIGFVGRNLSIENSLSFFDDRVYFANSGGRILGLDISNVENGVAPIVFDYWVGDDVDASIVIDEEGMLYVSVELERFNERSKELGQFLKLDPYTKNNPYVWGIEVPKEDFSVGGIWATPALYKNYLYVPTHTGRLLGVDKNKGKIIWEEKVDSHSWSSPVVIDDDLLIGTCGGDLKKYSLYDPENPVLNWSFRLGSGSCIESTPAVWNGEIFVGTRNGYFYKVGEKL